MVKINFYIYRLDRIVNKAIYYLTYRDIPYITKTQTIVYINDISYIYKCYVLSRKINIWSIEFYIRYSRWVVSIFYKVWLKRPDGTDFNFLYPLVLLGMTITSDNNLCCSVQIFLRLLKEKAWWISFLSEDQLNWSNKYSWNDTHSIYDSQ